LWWSSARAPEPGWDAAEQLRAAGLIDGDTDDDQPDQTF
jgi:hypothetical protein